MGSAEKEKKRITRREFAKGAAVVGAGVLAGCASPTPQVVKETVEVEKVVKETVEVPVEVTKIVEVPAGGAAPAAGPATIEVLDPSGAFEVTTLFAPRLDTLDGKTICFLSDDEWMSWRTFPLLEELLTQQYPTIKIIRETEFPTDGDHRYPDFEAHPDILKEMGCDAAIVGNAG
jgi:hypothetical protein